MPGGSQPPLWHVPPPMATNGSGVVQLETAGGGVELLLLTKTVRAADVVTLPAASRAIALRVCAPLTAPAVFQLMAYDAVVSGLPRLTPLSVNCTDAIPTLSEADAEIVTTPLTAAPLDGDVRLTDGATVSATELLTVTVRDDVLVLPDASRATARRVWDPLLAPSVFQLMA